MKKVLFSFIFILSIMLCSNIYASEIIDGSNISQLPGATFDGKKLQIIGEVLGEYQKHGYYNQRSYVPITLNNVEMMARLDCSGFISAYVVDYRNRLLGETNLTGMSHTYPYIDLASINFQSEGDPIPKKYFDKITVNELNDLEVGDILWSGDHFLIYGGMNCGIPVFYNWSGTVKKDDKEYKDYTAKDTAVIASDVTIQNNTIILMSDLDRAYTKTYRLKDC